MSWHKRTKYNKYQ